MTTNGAPLPVIYVTPLEACRLCMISRATLYKIIAEGRLPILKVGSLTRIRVLDLMAMIEAGAVPARNWKGRLPGQVHTAPRADDRSLTASPPN